MTLCNKLRAYALAGVDRLWVRMLPKIDQLYYTGGGLGDELMLTAVAAEARKLGRPLSILTNRPEVWEDNTDPVQVVTNIEKWFRFYFRKFIQTQIKHLPYTNSIHEHLGEQIGLNIGIKLPANWRPVYRPRGKVAGPAGAIVLQNSCRGAQFSAYTKEWPFDRWQILADSLRQEGHSLVQIGTGADPLIEGAMDFRGRTSLADAAATLEKARLFIGLESGLMHLAAAVGAPSVIVYGGRTRPWETGYPWHWHVADTSIPCAGCALNTDCPHDLQCMKGIGVDEVWGAVQRSLKDDSAPGFPAYHQRQATVEEMLLVLDEQGAPINKKESASDKVDRSKP